MRYLVTGSRAWSDFGPIADFVKRLRPGDAVAHGGASRGADQMLHWLLTDKRSGVRRARMVYTHGEDGTVGRKRISNYGDIDVDVFPADWAKHRPQDEDKKNPAGMIRNRWMVRTFRPEVVVYFRGGGHSPGTDNCIDVAREYGVPTIWSIDEFLDAHATAEREEDEE